LKGNLMHRILEKYVLTEGVTELVVEAPRIARKRKAGQFVIVKMTELGERIPLTIADANAEKGTITLIFQTVGKSTDQMSRLPVGFDLMDVVGPLGNPTHVDKFGNVVCVGGGIGVAPVHPIARALKDAGNNVIGIIGARTQSLLIMEDRMKKACHELLISTDDGSYGYHGFVTGVLQQVVDRGTKIDLVVAIGPVPMMSNLCKLTKTLNLKTLVSLNPIMVDGTGMCGACRVTVGGKTKFVCVDGPEFDGHEVDFVELMKRQRAYLPQERVSWDRYKAQLVGSKKEVVANGA
jgi:ferredoxin--NADP+ reductase